MSAVAHGTGRVHPRLVAVCTGRREVRGTPGAEDPLDRPWESAIWKTPVTGRVRVGVTGLDGDVQADARVHGGPEKAVLAYASDYGLLATALLPHAVSPRSPAVQLATLDHALWAHRPFRADEWLLYAMDSPAAAGARGFTRGSFYTRDGTLVASVTQEGLMRPRDPNA